MKVSDFPFIYYEKNPESRTHELCGKIVTFLFGFRQAGVDNKLIFLSQLFDCFPVNIVGCDADNHSKDRFLSSSATIVI